MGHWSTSECVGRHSISSGSMQHPCQLQKEPWGLLLPSQPSPGSPLPSPSALQTSRRQRMASRTAGLGNRSSSQCQGFIKQIIKNHCKRALQKYLCMLGDFVNTTRWETELRLKVACVWCIYQLIVLPLVLLFEQSMNFIAAADKTALWTAPLRSCRGEVGMIQVMSICLFPSLVLGHVPAT